MSAATAQWTSLESAMAQFLQAGRNEEILLAALGRLDCAHSSMFDALEYDGRPARTWKEAFIACAGGRSVGGTRTAVKDGKVRVTRASRIVRSWARFDLAALRALDPALEALELPACVYEAQADAAIEAWEAGLADLDGYADAAQAAYYSEDAPPADPVVPEAAPVAPEAPEADSAEWLDAEVATALLDACEAARTEIEVDEEMIVEEMTDDGWRWCRAA